MSKQWLKDQLHQHHVEVDDEILQYILSIPNPTDAAEYLSHITNLPVGSKFIKEFVSQNGFSNSSSSKSQAQPQSASNKKKAKNPNPNPNSNPNPNNQTKKTNNNAPGSVQVYKKPDIESQVYFQGDKKQKNTSNAPEKDTKKNEKPKDSSKQKFKTLDLQSLKEALLPGRHPCPCQASRHKLLTNCTNCGRIVCEQEGPGPCMTCKSELFDKKEQTRIFQSIKENLQKQPKNDAELTKAQEYKNRLLEYDRTSAKRTKVIDDEMDYFSSETNNWLSPKERDSLKIKVLEMVRVKEEKRKQNKVTLDLVGRRVVESLDEEQLDQKLRQMYLDEIETQRNQPSSEEGYINQNLKNSEFSPKYVQGKNIKSQEVKKEQTKSRVQHNFEGGTFDVFEDEGNENDPGLCMSMWQPWASLLVYGIKMVEGRSWPTTHRGRLWIAAAAKKPTPEEMKAVIDEHNQQFSTPLPQPKFYPTSCVLGCVDIVDCLSQQEYQKKVPDPLLRQSESQFVFICKNPRILTTPIPISGQHKIWSLESEVHRKCKALLE